MLKPGLTLFDKQFVFDDDTIGEKILIVLDDGHSTGVIIAVKTTSKEKFKSLSHGCNITDKYPNFYIPKESAHLNKNTWVGLNRFYEISYPKFLNGRKREENPITEIGTLPIRLTNALLLCAIKSYDITNAQKAQLEQVLRRLQNNNV